MKSGSYEIAEQMYKKRRENILARAFEAIVQYTNN